MSDTAIVRYLKQFHSPGVVPDRETIEVPKKEYQEHVEQFGATAFLYGHLYWIEAAELPSGSVRISLTRPTGKEG